MVNWEKLATDLELEGMWKSSEMEQEIRNHEIVVLRFNEKTSPTQVAYQQGILRGLLVAKGFPDKQRDIQRNKSVDQVLEEQKGTRFAESMKRFRALRFGSV
jgi:hypothetical protein